MSSTDLKRFTKETSSKLNVTVRENTSSSCPVIKQEMTEEDMRNYTKERMKKDNHNISKFGLFRFTCLIYLPVVRDVIISLSYFFTERNIFRPLFFNSFQLYPYSYSKLEFYFIFQSSDVDDITSMTELKN